LRNGVFVNGADGPASDPQLLGAVTLRATGSSGKLIKASVHDRLSPIIGPQCSTRENEVAHSGVVALMYSGTAGGAVPCYCYFQVFDVTIAITRSTRLAYWIYPQQDNGCYVAVDFICTDGTTLRDSGSVDHNGASMHPNAGHGGAIRPNEWSQIVCNVGQKLAGRTIDKILVAFDRPGGRGQFRGYIDDIVVIN
jgi:hypothetical protein